MLQGLSLRWGKSPYKHPGRFLGTGNRCGHNPEKGEAERYQAPKSRRLSRTHQQLLDAAADYYWSPTILPTLSNLNGRAKADGDPRCNRSEGRAAESLVLRAIIQCIDFASMRVGTPKADGNFIPRSCGYLAKLAGLMAPDCDPDYPQPSQRFVRAWRRLKLAGAFTVHRVAETLPDGRVRARPAIKHVNMDFLVSMARVGYQALKDLRTWASNKLKKAKKKHREQFPAETDAEKARRNLVAGKAAGGGVRSLLPKKRRGVKDIADADPEKEKQRHYSQARNARFVEIVANNPNATAAQVRQLLDIEFPPYQERRQL